MNLSFLCFLDVRFKFYFIWFSKIYRSSQIYKFKRTRLEKVYLSKKKGYKIWREILWNLRILLSSFSFNFIFILSRKYKFSCVFLDFKYKQRKEGKRSHFRFTDRISRFLLQTQKFLITKNNKMIIFLQKRNVLRTIFHIDKKNRRKF